MVFQSKVSGTPKGDQMAKKMNKKMKMEKDFDIFGDLDSDDDDDMDEDDGEQKQNMKTPVAKTPKGKQALSDKKQATSDKKVSFQIPGKNTPAKLAKKENSVAKKPTPAKVNTSMKEFKGMKGNANQMKKTIKKEEKDDEDDDDDNPDLEDDYEFDDCDIDEVDDDSEDQEDGSEDSEDQEDGSEKKEESVKNELNQLKQSEQNEEGIKNKLNKLKQSAWNKEENVKNKLNRLKESLQKNVHVVEEKTPEKEEDESDDDDDDDDEDEDDDDLDLDLDDDDDDDEDDDDDDDDDDEDDDDEDQEDSMQKKKENVKNKLNPVKQNAQNNEESIKNKLNQLKQSAQKNADQAKEKTPGKNAAVPKEKKLEKSPKLEKTPKSKEKSFSQKVLDDAARKRERDARTLYIGNLPSDITIEEIKALSSDIIDVVLPKKDANKRKVLYGFLEFSNEAKAEENYTLLQKKKIRDQLVVVDFAGEKSKNRAKAAKESEEKKYNTRKLYVTGIPINATLDQIAKFFPKAFQITLNTSPLFRNASINYASEKDAAEAFAATKEAEISGKKITVLYSLVGKHPKKSRKRNMKRNRSGKDEMAPKKRKLETQRDEDDDDDDDDDSD